ncbi:epimerase [Palleronia sp. KMU-117]|uniref:epimerase n=1 Tax=Palleronia sp. KMU-117 TaxID=3434108 RepID=UPI003D7262CA
MSGTALVLGPHGRFASHVALALEAAGWTVRRFDRQRDRLPDAAMGADLIVNGWNPPYPDWAAQLPVLTDRLIEAGRACGATILQPANVYVYGDGSPEVLTPQTPHRATNPLGRLRIAMEGHLRDSGLPVILLRAGDFIDTEPSGNWFDRVIAKDAARGRFAYPGDADIPHAWAYLPDLAAAAVVLANSRGALPGVCEILFPGHTLTGRELCAATARALGRPVTLRRMSLLPLHLARPFWPMARHLIEMSYLWRMPHRLVDDRLARLAPDLVQTPIDIAVARALGQKVDPDQPVTQPAV